MEEVGALHGDHVLDPDVSQLTARLRHVRLSHMRWLTARSFLFACILCLCQGMSPASKHGALPTISLHGKQGFGDHLALIG